MIIIQAIKIQRKNLGIEVAIEKLFLAQKSLIGKCNGEGVPVIISSQLMETMIRNSRPNASEVNDIAAAILDGVDGCEMGPETAKGNWPVLSVRTLDNIIRQAEVAVWRKQMFSVK